ncbi:hypothetical protein DY120_00655 [Apilactobacillus micheneri]|uniref:Uncharacterized protein n=1 Tax=Apilactobacillus micheneri TaxID=1899430 RepID=A0ABY2YY41_9LACO|nr:hypothetical protein DY114_00655 [Apilactobacillus micheneri]TPR26994.1 hypothetical protein DY111_00655 [Apilactobacillus micheneri]TPR27852.1 hypothetical protein DY113_04430 [Apilactobacillus micheneri]TPR31757.1 hypothetical protein DY117_00655 [Apilactobacillus micheneri]TPR32161.1 hypothetical protein DY120_00655 [Apilactobacillus micheneri]
MFKLKFSIILLTIILIFDNLSINVFADYYDGRKSRIIIKTNKPQPMVRIEPNLNDFFPPIIVICKTIIIILLIIILILLLKILINKVKK